MSKQDKFPQALFDYWRDLIGQQQVSLPALAKLVSCQNVSDDRRVNCIKEAAKLFQKTHDQVDQVRWIDTMATVGYFATNENLSRRTFVPLVEQAARLLDTSYFNDAYLAYITNDSRIACFNNKPLSQKALTIYATLKFPLGQAVITQHYRDTLAFLVKGLEKALLASTEEALLDIQFTSKTLLVLLSRQLGVSVDMFKQQDPLFGRILHLLIQICMDTTTPKECNQVGGMAMGAMINLAEPAYACDWVLAWFFHQTEMSVLGMSRPQISWEGRDAPMVFVLRGLVSSLSEEILTLTCPSIHVPTQESGTWNNLNDALFASINMFCARADLDPSCKVIAFESMATWLQQTQTMMAHHMDAVSRPIATDNMNMLVQYVWDHWDDPTDSIQHKMRSIFELVLSTFQRKCAYYQQDETSFTKDLLGRLLSMDWHRKVKYALLNMMVDRMDTSQFLSMEPDLIHKCMQAMDSFILCPQISFFIVSFLSRRIQDTIPGHAKFNGHNGKIKPGSDPNATEAWIQLWTLPALHALTASSELLRKNASGFLLSPLLKISTGSFWYMMDILQQEDHPVWQKMDTSYRLNAFIAVLKAGRGLDIVDGHAYGISISINTLTCAIYHQDAQVRLDVLGLLCESRKATAEITSTELDMLKLFIPLNMNSTAPEFRQQMCAYLGKLFTRLRGHFYAQHRNYTSLLTYADKHQDEKRQNALLDAHDCLVMMHRSKAWLVWLLDHVAQSLYPGASYQRIATALRILSTVCKVFGVTESTQIISIATPKLTKLLMDTFLNPYDFNRVQAFDILGQFPSPLPGIDPQEAQDLLWWGLNHVVSTRAGESDSGAMIFRLVFSKYVMDLGCPLVPEQQATQKEGHAAHVFTEQLLDMLEKQVKVAQSNLMLAAQQHPMHGTLLALQYVLGELKDAHEEAWQKTFERAMRLIQLTCDTALPVLSDASPEGNVPSRFDDDDQDEEDDMDQDDMTGPKHQVILSCCWRAVKEASSLLQVMIRFDRLSHQDLIQSGMLFRHLLTHIRHRGAFSAVYPAYVSLNTRLLTSGNAELTQLPMAWLQENLDSLVSSNISITRRSAGLPLCILAIVSSEPSAKKLLRHAMAFLIQLASDPPPPDADQRIDLPQVHAYNIMRTIFMDSKLGHHVLSYASQGFSLAIQGFSSHSWAIRNCSVMLFSTLLQRTLGTKKTRDEHAQVNTLTGREFFVRFPDLHPYLLNQLDVAVNQLLTQAAHQVHPGLYPILTLLSRMQPAMGEDKDHVLTPFIPLVMPCASSAIYKTREMAARALVPLVSDIVPTVQELMVLSTTQNEIHGRLLQVQFLLRGHFYSPKDTKDMHTQFIEHMPSVFHQALKQCSEWCPMNTALFLDILYEFCVETTWIKDASLNELASTCFASMREAVIGFCTQRIGLDISGIGAYLLRTSMAAHIVNHALMQPQVQLDGILYLLQDRDYEVRLVVLQKLLAFYKTTPQPQGTQALQTLLVSRTYEGEENLNCYVLTAQLLMAVNPKQPYLDTTLPFSLESYWNQLVLQFKQKRALSVTESVLPLLGALLSQILGSVSLSNDWVQQCLVTWSDYITIYSQKEITLPLREAVVKSLQLTSKQVFDPLQGIDHARVTAGLAITQLLQDDDVDVRQDTAAIVSNAFGLSAPVHHERALELVYRFLAEQFSQSDRLQSDLIQVLDYPITQQVLAQELDPSKALFAKENPNIYKEDLMDVQWAHVDLDTMLLKHTLKPLMWEDKAQAFVSFLQELKRLSEHFMKYGPFGISSRQSVFMAMYSTALYLHLVVDQLDTMSETTLDAIKTLNDTVYELEQAWIHPLIWDLLRGEKGLYAKLNFVLRRHGFVEHTSMFLLAPDSRK